MAKEKVSVTEVYSNIMDISKQIEDLEEKISPTVKKIKDLEKTKDLLQKQLQVVIPPNTSKNGIFHKVTFGKTYKYGQIYDALIAKVLPKTKIPEAEAIKESLFTQTEKHSFESDKE